MITVIGGLLVIAALLTMAFHLGIEYADKKYKPYIEDLDAATKFDLVQGQNPSLWAALIYFAGFLGFAAFWASL